MNCNKHKGPFSTYPEKKVRLKLNGVRNVSGCKQTDFIFTLKQNLEDIVAQVEALKPDYVIIDFDSNDDHIHRLTLPEACLMCVRQLQRWCDSRKLNQIAIFIVGHVTKRGHLLGLVCWNIRVDTVLYFSWKDKTSFPRASSPWKPFRSTNEIGVFEMQFKKDTRNEVTNPKSFRRTFGWRALQPWQSSFLLKESSNWF